MAPHSSSLAWKIPWVEEPGRLQSMGSQRVVHDCATSLSLSLSCIGEGNGNPLQCSCLENPRDGRAWWAAIYGVAQSRTRLKRLSSSSSSDQYVVWSVILWTQFNLSQNFRRMNGLMDGWMDWWKDGGTDGRMGGWMGLCFFYIPSLLKLPPISLFIPPL